VEPTPAQSYTGIVQTAKENGLNPFAYLCYVFEKCRTSTINDPAALDELLPYSKSLPTPARRDDSDKIIS